VLVVDPDPRARERTVAAVREALPNAVAREADSLAAAREVLAAEPVDAVVTEADLGDGGGLELAAELRPPPPDAGAILYTGADDVDTTDFEDTVVAFVPRGAPDSDAHLATALEAATVAHSQAAYPVSEDEPDRLAALSAHAAGVDRVREPLDRLAEAVAAHFDATSVAVSFVDDHELAVVVDSGPAVAPAERGDSICTFAIVEAGVTAVEDVAADPRFADNERLREAGIRAYLGAPLRTADGYALGTVAVYDDTPRGFSATEREFLAAVAEVAVDLLALASEVES